MLPDIDRVTSILRDVAETEIMPRFRSLARSEIREKGPGDLVTVADEAAERALSRQLLDLLPGSVVVGEEAASADPAVLDRMGGAEPAWIVDPIDGTYNFAHGRPAFAVMVALVRGGETLAGWIHDPCGSRTAVGAKGQGAWMEGSRLAVARPVPVAQMRGYLSTRYFDPPIRAAVEARRGLVAEAGSLLSAAHEYLRVAAGEAHFAVYRSTMPWDHAAGTLLVAEAGGHSARFNGAPYAPAAPGIGLMTATDPESWRALHRTILEGAVPDA